MCIDLCLLWHAIFVDVVVVAFSFILSTLSSLSMCFFFFIHFQSPYPPADSTVFLVFLLSFSFCCHLKLKSCRFHRVSTIDMHWEYIHTYWCLYWNIHICQRLSKTKLQQQNSLTQKIWWNKGFFLYFSILPHTPLLYVCRWLSYVCCYIECCFGYYCICPVLVLLWFLFELFPSLDEGERVYHEKKRMSMKESRKMERIVTTRTVRPYI